MASSLNADNGVSSGSAGLKSTADSSGVLELQTNGTAAISISTSQIVSLTNALAASSGGTGLTSPGTNGNILTSNGTAWVSSAPAGGGVTSLNGATGAITTTTSYALGSFVMGRPANVTSYAVNDTIAGSSLYAAGSIIYRNATVWRTALGSAPANATTLVNTGSWRCVSPGGGDGSAEAYVGLWVRYA
jgi:hypothetical protein